MIKRSKEIKEEQHEEKGGESVRKMIKRRREIKGEQHKEEEKVRRRCQQK